MFTDRKEAGRELAAALTRFKPESPVVLAVPRGGVPVAYEVATALEAPLDNIVARHGGKQIGSEGSAHLCLATQSQGA
jgi:putative phosphoribosyl transferase